MNKIFTILLMLVLSLPITVWAVDDTVSLETPPAVTAVVEQNLESEYLTSTGAMVQDDLQYKQPISKRKLAKKFLTGMGAVIASSLILFFGLTLYNRIRDSLLNKVKTPEGEVSLQTPDNLRSAFKTFLEKTKWDN